MSSAYIPVELRRSILEIDKYRCAYCLTAEILSGIGLSIDHIKPTSDGGETIFESLCSACRPCNENKGTRTTGLDPQTNKETPLFNLRAQNWADHFRWDTNGTRLEGVTGIGRATVSTLKLNNPLIIKARSRWVSVNWHLPQDN